MEKKENAIEVRSLTKDYGKGRGIFDFSFDVKRGEVFALVGTNGSGKTTTIRHMMGFLRGDSGSIQIEGLDAWKNADKVKRLVGYVPGQIDFPDVGTGTAFLKIQADLMGLKDLNEMNRLIDMFKIDITAPLRRMSKGMKQKMALVAAFMGDADIYLLDEPSTGLDPLMRDTLIALIKEKKAAGKTVFMSSHIFKEIEDTADTVMFIKDGHILDTVHRSRFTDDPHETYTILFKSEKDFVRYIDTERVLAGKTFSERIQQTSADDKTVLIVVPMRAINDFMKDLSAYSIAGLSNQPYSIEKYYTTIVEKQEV